MGENGQLAKEPANYDTYDDLSRSIPYEASELAQALAQIYPSLPISLCTMADPQPRIGW